MPVDIELAPQHKRGLHLANPVMNAAGVLGFATEYRRLVDFDRLGAFVTNALTATPRTPAHPPNVVELPDGVVLHTGLPNPGVAAALRRYARDWQRLGTPSSFIWRPPRPPKCAEVWPAWNGPKR